MVMIFADREPEWRCLDGAADWECDPSAKSVCGFEPGSWEWMGDSTVVEWGLFCAGKFKVGLVQAVFFGGCMIGKSSKRPCHNTTRQFVRYDKLFW
ncbi:organic cation/carnitine transporter 4-like [Vigna umbellata]|uniref:organic cation/carnitine transporter 4-like n=1 Tax=Vigna umbellata TaxID=87088 RepID=UPI001F5ED1F9|nr:organic cation/carnitine transporter 4-like [Vigna umbellata]